VALAAGSTFGPFRIIALLGKGGMASVYKAYQAKLDRHVALKVLPPEFLHEDSFAKRFEREARVVAKLEHPNIVPIYDYGIDDGIPWMAMRMLPVGTLADLLKQGRLGRNRLVSILSQVAKALDHAHNNGVIHRDVKPSNILLDAQDLVYVADFGLARLVKTSAVLTKTGMMAGTPQYMAPEQAMAKEVNRHADIYALGIVAYEMLTGAVPFTADTPVGVLMQHANEPPEIPPLGQVPEVLMQPVLKALAKDPADRWDLATALTTALSRGLDQLVGGSTVAVATADVVDEETSRPTAVRRVAAVTSALVVVVIGVFLIRSIQSPGPADGGSTEPGQSAVSTSTPQLEEPQSAESEPPPPRAEVSPPPAVAEPSPVRRDEPATEVPDATPPVPAAPIQATPDNTQEIAAIFERARSAVADERYEDAVREYEAVLALEPDRTEARQGLVDVRTQIDQRDTIRRDVAVLLDQADGLLQQRDYDAAIERYEAALRLDASNEAAAGSVARARTLKAQADAAVARILGTTTAEPSDLTGRIQTLLEQGREAQEERRFEDAIDAFDAVLAIDQENTEATQGRAQAVVGQWILGSTRPRR